MARISWIQIALKRTAARLFLPRVAGKRWEERTRIHGYADWLKKGRVGERVDPQTNYIVVYAARSAILTSTRKNGNRPCFSFFFQMFRIGNGWMAAGRAGRFAKPMLRPRWKYSLCLFAILIKYVADNIIRLELYLCNSSFVRSKRDAPFRNVWNMINKIRESFFSFEVQFFLID